MGEDQGQEEGPGSQEEMSSEKAPIASGWQNAFGRPWIKRMGELDDGTLRALSELLIQLRRVKYGVTGTAFAAGMAVLGSLPIENPIYKMMFYLTAGLTFALPTVGVTSLAVRQVFLREARKLGVGKGTAMLLMTHAERKVRHLSPFLKKDSRVEQMMLAVRNWDQAEDMT
jgi:hypothetical protein